MAVPHSRSLSLCVRLVWQVLLELEQLDQYSLHAAWLDPAWPSRGAGARDVYGTPPVAAGGAMGRIQGHGVRW